MKTNERRELEDGTDRTCLVDGSTVGSYVTTFLAAGGMSVAYKGERDGQTYVLKEVDVNNTVNVPSLMSEKSLLERLNHPGLVGFEEFFTYQGYYYLVVEYVPGQALSTWLEQERQADLEEVVEWGLQLADIFEYLHSLEPPVIYRDLKPENVLWSDRRVKLIDFGIARIHKGDRRNDTTLLGSPMTASPEHYGQAETDRRSDVYTLAATLYQMLVGSERGRIAPFTFAPVTDFRDDVPPEISEVLLKSLNIKASMRHQTAREFKDALCRAAGRPAPTSTPTPITAPAPAPASAQPAELNPPRAKGPLKAILLIASLLVVVALAWNSGFLKTDSGQPYGGTAEGLHEANLEGDIFSSGIVEGRDVVMLGEDVGLFQVNGWREQTSSERAETLAKRLNGFYHQFCSLCGKSKLEPGDIRVGRYTQSKDVAVFYAHMHDDGRIFAGPLLLATITSTQAEEAGATPRFVAACWRDLLRDTVQLSRGFAVYESPLGDSLKQALMRARTQLKTGEISTGNLRRVLREVTGKESLALRKTFLLLPDQAPSLDSFAGIRGYEPLNI